MQGCILNTVATDALMLKFQANSISADQIKSHLWIPQNNI